MERRSSLTVAGTPFQSGCTGTPFQSSSAACPPSGQALFPRSIAAAVEGDQLNESMFGDDTPHGLINMFNDHEQTR
ncbi:hypothetical protein ACWC09_33535 [Streptomyces sp. NPDC001617]